MARTPRIKCKPEGGSRSWIRAATLRTLDAVIGELGDFDAALAEHGLRRSQLSRPGAVIAASQVANLLETLAARLDITDLGMQLGRRQRASDIADPIEAAIFNAPTLRDAFLFGARHVSYYSPAVRFAIETSSAEEDVRFHYRFDADQADVRQVTEYGCLQACLNIIDLADARPSEVWFRHDRLSAQEVYDENFRAPVRFGMPVDAIFLSREDYVKPLMRRDARIYDEAMEISATRQAQSKPLSAHLHAEIERLLPEKKCSYDMVCESIGLSPRTMRRYLALENTTFKDLKNSVRRDRIRRALTNPALRISDLAQHAGYYDPASIRRNIRRWG